MCRIIILTPADAARCRSPVCLRSSGLVDLDVSFWPTERGTPSRQGDDDMRDATVSDRPSFRYVGCCDHGALIKSERRANGCSGCKHYVIRHNAMAVAAIYTACYMTRTNPDQRPCVGKPIQTTTIRYLDRRTDTRRYAGSNSTTRRELYIDLSTSSVAAA